MRNKFIVSMFVLLGMVITGASAYAADCCGGGTCVMAKATDTSDAKSSENTDPQKTAPVKTKKKAVSQIYQCPMHPEVTSNKPGNCPKCGMKLIKIDITKKTK